MLHNLPNQPLLLQMLNRAPRQAAVDLQPLNEYALADEAERRDLLHDAVIQRLVQNDVVLRLVLDFALGPLLLLRGFSAPAGCGCCFCFGLRLWGFVVSKNLFQTYTTRTAEIRTTSKSQTPNPPTTPPNSPPIPIQHNQKNTLNPITL